MKKIKYLILPLIALFAFTSCIDEDNDELTGDATTGGLVKVNNPLLSYVVGGGNTYSATASIYQGAVQTSSVSIYNSFTNSVTGDVSNRVLLETIEINGAGLPANDGELNIGDFWNLEYVSSTSEGGALNNAKTTKVAVGTRYAGIYTVTESAYWNSGGYIDHWDNTDRIIESVDATIYRHAGLAYWDDNEFFFTVDNTTGYITVMDVDLDEAALLHVCK